MKTAFAGTAALVLILLTACTPPPTTEEREANENPVTEPLPGPGGNAISQCLVGKWNLDVADLAAQMLAHLQASGSPIRDATGEGFEMLEFTAEGLVGVDSNITYTMTADLDQGMTLVVVQHQKGLSAGSYSVDNDAVGDVEFGQWDTDMVVTTQSFINGTATAEFPVSIPPSQIGEGFSSLVCDTDALTIITPGSFAAHTYLRVTD